MTSSAHISWLIENRVIHVQVIGSYDVNVAQHIIPQIQSMFASAPNSIHILCDMSRVTSIARDIREPIQKLEIIRYHEKLGWLIFVTNNRLLGFAGQIGSLLLGVKYRAVTTVDEALATLLSIDPTLSALPRDESAA